MRLDAARPARAGRDARAGAVADPGRRRHASTAWPRRGRAVSGAPTRPSSSNRQGPTYVSRGALKLEKALDTWHIDPSDKIVLDVGASTGGFTDLLLRRGATRVYAVDVGYGQLHYRLRSDPRVVAIERTNIRHLTELPERAELGVVDVSFISLRLALPPVFELVDRRRSWR